MLQVLLALRLYDKIEVPRRAPSWLGDAHRLVGTLAFVVTLPVAYQCLWALGFQSTDTRVLVHSLLGCFFYGIFTVKVLAVRVRGLPGPTLPVAGGLVFRRARRRLAHQCLVVPHVPTARVAGVLMFRKLVNVVEVLAVVGAVVAVVLLFANEPDSSTGSTPASPGAALFAANCASCHGADGGGGIGPQLAGGAVVERFPSVDDQISLRHATGAARCPRSASSSHGADSSSGRVHTHTVSTDRERHQPWRQ